ncbi:hypothetical protein L1049_004734 [Liquidambar formosana]|uniref:Reverse transcriptase Ty1/copia-type domain-containing protein n=1 Tax=Liquidambar formosana TaxID=63359 RepID=A0AAP0X0Z5_LIQFO
MKGLEHAFKLDELFIVVLATGARAWAPTSGLMPPLYQQSSGVKDEIDVEDNDGFKEDNIENTSLTSLECDRKGAMSERSGKQNKTTKSWSEQQSNHAPEVSRLKHLLEQHFHIKDLGLLRYFLGIEIARSSDGIFLCQRKYIVDLLNNMGMMGCRSIAFPMEQNLKLHTFDGKPFIDAS